MPGTLHAYVVDGTQLKVKVVSDQGVELTLGGAIDDVAPVPEAGSALDGNPALVSNMWAFAKAWYMVHTTSDALAAEIPDPEEQRAAFELVAAGRKLAEKQSEAFAKVAQWIADVADEVNADESRTGWCSSCFTKAEHHKSNRPGGQMPVYVCQACGTPTLPCVAPGCGSMAIREGGAVRVPQYCAEHRHDIPGFEKAVQNIGGLHDYEDYLKYEKANLSRATKIAVLGAAGLAIGTPAALLAAPAVGGAIGSLGMFGGLSGAAATSHGLALLGGGAIAAGGLGMAGGTAVVTAVGAAVGGALGASVSNAYVREDKSFRIELLRPGSGGVPVVVANGFLTEGDAEKWGGWRGLVDARYPDSPVYRVRWGAKELKDFGVLGAGIAGKQSGILVLKGGAAKATKLGAKLLGKAFGPALLAADLAKNPWHVAKNRADKTGVVVGDLLARTDAESYVLIGHSLGARVMAVAAEALSTKPGGPRVQAVHLLGAAMGAKGDWTALTAAVDDAVYGYYSANDNILRIVYKVAQAGQTAAGLVGFTPPTAKLVNVDVSEVVKDHFQYQDRIQLS
ncbi:DUF726 domain-containing protein [Xylanimonas allomyrinae]|nr:DUF726 domain-containing protein [Xylanimonas allomyrinae]